MSHFATAWAFNQTGITSTAKLVLIFLADYHNNETGLCFPSRATLAEKCCCDERTVTRIIKDLVDAGLVIAETQFDRSGRQTSNIYKLNMGGGQNVEGEVDKMSTLEPVINNYSDTTYRSDDVISIDDNYEEPPDDTKTFWDEAAGMLKSLGLVDKTARSMTGRFLKLSGNDQEKVIRAITEAVEVGTDDPIPYVSAILKGRKTQKKKEVDDAFAELRAASEARKAQWREQGLLEDDDAGGRRGVDPVGVQPEQHEKPKSVRKATRRSYGTISARRVAEIVRPDQRIAIDASFPPDSGGSKRSGTIPF